MNATPRRLAAALVTLLVALPAPPAASRPKKRTPRPVAVYEVASGDTLGGIAHKHGCTVDELKTANELSGDLITIGQKLDIPTCKGPAKEGGARTVTHTVLPGETLGAIAARYGDSVADIRARNRLKGDVIRVGQDLKIKTALPLRERRKFVYTIESGDTLSGIAHRFGMSVTEIQGLNPKKDPKRLRIGDRISLYMEGPAERSKTVGRPQDGKLVNAEQLPAGPGYYRRRPHRAWATNETVTHLLNTIAEVKQKHPKVHDLAIGDLSAKDGGRIPPHKSHQSGRDADIGYYFQNQPRQGPKAFIRADRNPLDFEATWTLLTALIGDNPRASRVEYIFMNYRVQKILYEWAKKKGVPERTLSRMFQYPHGKRAMHGMIRHEPGHDAHMHVRFKCPRGQERCS